MDSLVRASFPPELDGRLVALGREARGHMHALVALVLEELDLENPDARRLAQLDARRARHRNALARIHAELARRRVSLLGVQPLVFALEDGVGPAARVMLYFAD